MKKFALIYCLVLINFVALAQQKFILSGYVKDKTGQPLPGTGVYVSGYKIATSANDSGYFQFSLAPGNYDILIQTIGYIATNSNVSITDKSVQLNIALEENVRQLAEITVRPDPDYQYYFNQFKDRFLGRTPNATQCKLLNPEVLIIDYDRKERILKVKTDEFLLVENYALGYKIKYLLKNFEYNYNTKILYYEGYPVFEDLPGSQSKQKKWAKERLIAYNGSNQHFYRSLYNGNIKDEGFIIHKIFRQENKERPTDSLISEKIKLIISSKNTLKLGLPHDSLNYWMKKKRLSKYTSVLSKAPILLDTLVKTAKNSLKSINFEGVLYVIYTKEKETLEYATAKSTSFSKVEVADNQVSYINLIKSPIYFYENGTLVDPHAALYEGYWTWEAVADSVPLDYLPSAQNK